MKRGTARSCAVLLLIPILTRPLAVAAQATADSSRGMQLHMPFFVPFGHHRHEAGRASSAEPDSTAFLRLEMGYDGNFRSPELSRDESSTINLDFTPSSRVELQADLDFWANEMAPGAGAVRGRGDMHLRGQWTAFTIHPGHVAVALQYVAKLPTANSATLGTGFVDHRFLVPISFGIGGLEIDAFGGADANGDASGLTWGPEGATTVTVALRRNVTVHGGFSAQKLDTDQPAGSYLSTGITWQLRPLIALDLGARHGVSSGTPSWGLSAGVTSVLITRVSRPRSPPRP